MLINDAHCHFFSERFFDALATQRGHGERANDLTHELAWDAPGDVLTLATRWVRELDTHGVGRAALIASVPGDETSVATAVKQNPDRFVGYFMLDPSASDATARARRALTEMGMRGLCLFPAMHHVPLHDERMLRIVEVAASQPGTVVFVHCGVLSVGVRKKLGLPSRFNMSLGNPLALHPLAAAFPNTPFVIPHFGAGLIRETLMLADVCPNVHIDTSSSNGWTRYIPGATLEAAFKQCISTLGPKRLLFGTDSSFFPRGWQKAIYDEQKRILDAIGTSEADQALIFGGNFDRLFS